MKTFTKNLFKVLFLTLVAASVMITIGCDEDDDEIDPVIGTWVLYEMQMGSEVLDAAALTEMGYAMTVVFTESAYTANGLIAGEVINEVGTWTREDANTVIITNTDGNTTLTKEGDYYTAEFEEGVTGKFKKQ